MEKDCELSTQMADRVHATQKECWANAYRAMTEPEMRGAVYVEGWARAEGGAPFEHGWLECGEAIIDVTLPDKALSYFPALRFDYAALQLTLRKGPRKFQLPIAWRYGWGGEDSPEYMAARDASGGNRQIEHVKRERNA